MKVQEYMKVIFKKNRRQTDYEMNIYHEIDNRDRAIGRHDRKDYMIDSVN
jgi:hypothetical protein